MTNLRDDLSKEIRRMEGAVERFFRHFSTFDTSFFSSTPHKFWRPFVDVYETQDKLVVKMELGGVKKTDVQISLENDVLLIRGVRKERSEERKTSYHQMEIHYGPFEVVIPLPLRVEQEKVNATFNNGILEVSLPKTKEEIGQQIKIEVEEK